MDCFGVKPPRNDENVVFHLVVNGLLRFARNDEDGSFTRNDESVAFLLVVKIIIENNRYT
ncbi:MAG: hypothetical protein LBC96_09865 [Lachnospiraceae bacterium]|jgi:hypothetical protein|nr:hypothetical protein [Lachnospiraceae bacterium]